MQNNEYISNETFEAFMSKKLGNRPGKRMAFPMSNQVSN